MIYQRKPTFSNSNNLIHCIHKASTFHKTSRKVRQPVHHERIHFTKCAQRIIDLTYEAVSPSQNVRLIIKISA